ncbi:hypothetical protein XENOCAPTIV_030654, partial [Xenoophorus captivus]
VFCFRAPPLVMGNYAKRSTNYGFVDVRPRLSIEARPSAGDNCNQHWSLSHSPVEHITSSSNGIHGNHPYASISGYAVHQPLALTKSYNDTEVSRGAISVPTQRQQNRPSVITCAPASNRNCNLSHCHMNGCPPTPPDDQRKTNAKTVCDPVIEEHFRRSLGENYKEAEAVSNSVSITGSVDDHFAKALGDAWLQIQARGTGHQTPESDPDGGMGKNNYFSF